MQPVLLPRYFDHHAYDSTVPTDVTTWEWLFETDRYVPFNTGSRGRLGTYSDAATHERLDFTEVKEKAIALSTALVRDCGLRPGQTVSLFSTNTVWYAVALWATIRVGTWPRRIGSLPCPNSDCFMTF